MVQDSIFIGKMSALISFLLGTALVVIAKFPMDVFRLMYIGIIFILIAFLVNTFILIHLLYLAYLHQKERKELLKTCGLMTLNIPIAIAYFYIIISSPI